MEIQVEYGGEMVAIVKRMTTNCSASDEYFYVSEIVSRFKGKKVRILSAKN